MGKARRQGRRVPRKGVRDNGRQQRKDLDKRKSRAMRGAKMLEPFVVGIDDMLLTSNRRKRLTVQFEEFDATRSPVKPERVEHGAVGT